jgi:hypothetical protein
MTTGSSLSVQVFDQLPQDLEIEVAGPDVALFAPNRPADDPAPEEAIPDPVQLFVGAVNQKMFPRPADRRCTSSAWIVDSAADLPRIRHVWRLHIEEADFGALRVLTNLLTARELDSVTVRAKPSSPQARRLDPFKVAYPAARANLPYAVEREEAIRLSKDRLIQIELSSPPSDEVYDGLSAVLELWSNLMLFGGYPPEDLTPRESGVFPEGPLLLDEVTVQMAFPEVFQSDEAAFNCILNHLFCLAQRGTPIALVRVR